MQNVRNVFILIGFAAISFLSIPVQAQEGLVCTTNDYALCSHAACECVDSVGQAADCQAYTGENPSQGWSRCKCPIVKSDEVGINPAYKANYAAGDLSCDERETPTQDSPYQLPEFVSEETDIYSTYSFGDSLNDKAFGTRESAKALICDTPDLFGDCLNMACYIPEGEEHAVCYCQNQKWKQNVDLDENCPSLAWNTFGGNCEQGNCDLGSQKVWSAACINGTMSAMFDVFATIRTSGLDQEFSLIPAYCDVNQ